MSEFILQVVIALLLARALSELLRKGDIHPIVGNIITGIILGPALLGFISPEGGIEYLAAFGLIILMFYIGLTSDPRTLFKQKSTVIVTGVLGVATTFILISVACLGLGLPLWASLFMALALSSTATEVVAVILEKNREVTSELKQVIIGASFIDDVFAVYLITLLRIFAEGGISINMIIIDSIKIVIFILVVIYISKLVVSKTVGIIYKIFSTPAHMVTSSIIIAFALALIARLAGLNEVIGAYLGGLAISRLREIHDPMLVNILKIESLSHNLRIMLEAFLTPLFFLYVGLLFKASINVNLIFLFITLLILAIVGKMLGCGLPILMFKKSKKDAIIVGAGMISRGALESAILVLALKANLITPEYYDLTLTVILCLTILAPIMLKLILKVLSR